MWQVLVLVVWRGVMVGQGSTPVGVANEHSWSNSAHDDDHYGDEDDRSLMTMTYIHKLPMCVSVTKNHHVFELPPSAPLNPFQLPSAPFDEQGNQCDFCLSVIKNYHFLCGMVWRDMKPWINIKNDLEPWKTNLEPWITIKTDLQPRKTNLEPWIIIKTDLEP